MYAETITPSIFKENAIFGRKLVKIAGNLDYNIDP
jgi:hypothetical protein